MRYLLIFDQEPDVGCFAYVDVNDNVNFDMLILVYALAFDVSVAVSCRQCCGSASGIPYPGSGAFLTPGPGIRDGLKSWSGSGMNNPDHISESLETVFWLKYLSSLMRIRDGKNTDPPGSAINIPDDVKLLFYFVFSSTLTRMLLSCRIRAAGCAWVLHCCAGPPPQASHTQGQSIITETNVF